MRFFYVLTWFSIVPTTAIFDSYIQFFDISLAIFWRSSIFQAAFGDILRTFLLNLRQ